MEAFPLEEGRPPELACGVGPGQDSTGEALTPAPSPTVDESETSAPAETLDELWQEVCGQPTLPAGEVPSQIQECPAFQVAPDASRELGEN